MTRRLWLSGEEEGKMRRKEIKVSRHIYREGGSM